MAAQMRDQFVANGRGAVTVTGDAMRYVGLANSGRGSSVAVMSTTDERSAIRRWTSDEVWRMVEIGLLDDDRRYELIDGELLTVPPQGEDHADAMSEMMMRTVLEYCDRGFKVRCQAPLGGMTHWIPESDLVVMAPLPMGQRTSPRPDQTVLVVEVAKTSHARDRRKSGVYASHGAPEFWLVDLVRREVLVHRSPLLSGDWGEVRVWRSGDRVPLPQIDADLEVDAIMGCAPGE